MTSVTSDYKRAQHWINDSEYDRFLRIYIIYIYVCICVYIYNVVQNHWGLGLVSISDMILSNKFSKAWGLYFIWSLELWHASQQQCCSTALSPPDSLRRVSNFQVKQSRIFETSSNGIWNPQQMTRKPVRVCQMFLLLCKCRGPTQMTLAAEIE